MLSGCRQPLVEDRVKDLGEFMVEVQVRGGKAVRRVVRVRAQKKPALE